MWFDIMFWTLKSLPQNMFWYPIMGDDYIRRRGNLRRRSSSSSSKDFFRWLGTPFWGMYSSTCIHRPFWQSTTRAIKGQHPICLIPPWGRVLGVNCLSCLNLAISPLWGDIAPPRCFCRCFWNPFSATKTPLKSCFCPSSQIREIVFSSLILSNKIMSIWSKGDDDDNVDYNDDDNDDDNDNNDDNDDNDVGPCWWEKLWKKKKTS